MSSWQIKEDSFMMLKIPLLPAEPRRMNKPIPVNLPKRSIVAGAANISLHDKNWLLSHH
jgi:hypothetical protein